MLFLTLIAQLYAPLGWLGSYYRTIQNQVCTDKINENKHVKNMEKLCFVTVFPFPHQMVDMENLFELMGTEPSVKDAPGAKDLVVSRGALAFENVSFGYIPGIRCLDALLLCQSPRIGMIL